jgi:hypothetical protein
MAFMQDKWPEVVVLQCIRCPMYALFVAVDKRIGSFAGRSGRPSRRLLTRQSRTYPASVNRFPPD